MNGPFMASRHDITIYQLAGLKVKISSGHRVFADNGYKGRALAVSTPNSRDPNVLCKFKSRARARHESFNGHIKNFK
jgi:hypothetical protein